jgi:hypothetical protein
MSSAAQSIFAFGIYLAISGATLVVAPNALFALLEIPTSTEVWPRVVGVLTLALAFYFIQAARSNVTEFFRWTTYVRVAVFTLFTALVLLGFVGPVLILFGAADLLGAMWTGLALRSSNTRGA